MCLKKVLFESLLDGTHECKFKTIPFDVTNSNWNFVFDFYETDFTPLLLLGTSNSVKIAVSFARAIDGVRIFVYSLNQKDGDPLRNALVKVTAEVATDGGGALGRCMKRKFNYTDVELIPRPNLVLCYNRIQSWAAYTNHYTCKCGLSKPHAKITIKVL